VTTDVCVGCLGSGQCWVCLATGYESPTERVGRCPRCAGSAQCHLCGDVSAHSLEPERPATLHRARVSTRSGGVRVLLVDDEPHLLDLISIWLTDDPRCAGVTTADSGDRALLSLAEECPDTIICDFQLGNATSAEYLQAFRSACPCARILIHTGEPETARAAGIVDRGADLVVEKGRVTLQELVDVALEPSRRFGR
jgi:CheY-like chemotaxis protein